MTDSNGATHVFRPTPPAGVVIAAIVLGGISLPGLFFGPPMAYVLGAGGVMLGLCALAAFGLFALYRSHVVCALDRDRRELRVTHVRWPLSSVEFTVPLDAIERVELERGSARGGRGGSAPSARIALALKDGSRRPLTTSYAGGTTSRDETVAVLRRWISEA